MISKRRPLLFAFAAAAALLAAAPLPAVAQEAAAVRTAEVKAWPPQVRDMDADAALKYSQAAIGRQVRDGVFVDHLRRQFSLSELRGRALVISFIYTRCASTCPTITASLEHAIDVAQETFGERRFEVLTVGFDVGVDEPARMAAFARQQGIQDPNWRFISADLPTILQLADDLGFAFEAKGGGYDHMAQVSLVDRDGIVRAQIYGESFGTPAFIEPMKQIVYGSAGSVFTVDGLVNKLLLYCTVYNERTDRYEFDYGIFINMFAGITVMAVPVWLMVSTWRRNRRERRRSGGVSGPATPGGT